MDSKIEQLEKEIEAIKLRNKRVEAEKAWETSFFRVVIISLLTYFVMILVMLFLDVANFLLSALIPTIGFIISTQSIPLIKKWWIKRHFQG